LRNGARGETLWMTRLARWRWLCFGALGLLYIAGYQTHWRIYPDSALYLELARNLVEGQGYVFRGHPHDIAYPLAPWVISGVWWLFGIGNFAAVNLVMLVCGLVALALVYRAVKLRIDRSSATAVVLLTGTVAVVYYYVFVPQTDVLFFLGTCAALAGYEGIRQPGAERSSSREPIGEWLLFTVGVWIAVSSRPTMWALALAIFATAAIAVVSNRDRWRHLAMAAVTGACLLLFFALDPRQSMHYSRSYAKQVSDISQAGSQMLESLRWWFDSGLVPWLTGLEVPVTAQPYIGAVLWAIPFLVALALLRWRLLWGFFALATVAMVLWHLPVPRYFMPIVPLLAVIGWWLAGWLHAKLPRPWATPVVVVLLMLWLVPNGLLIGRFIVRQHSEPFLKHHYGGHFYGLPKLGRRIGDSIPPDAWVFASDHTRVLTWYSQRNVAPPGRRPANGNEIESSNPLPMYCLSWSRGRPSLRITRDDLRFGDRLWVHRLPNGQDASLWRMSRRSSQKDRRSSASVFAIIGDPPGFPVSKKGTSGIGPRPGFPSRAGGR